MATLKMTCACGATVSKSSYSRHLKSQQHAHVMKGKAIQQQLYGGEECQIMLNACKDIITRDQTHMQKQIDEIRNDGEKMNNKLCEFEETVKNIREDFELIRKKLDEMLIKNGL